VPVDVSVTAPPPVTIKILQEEPEPFPAHMREEKFSVRLKDADLREALMTLADQCGLNMVFDAGVEGKISLVLNEVPLEAAVRAMLAAAGYTFLIRDGIIHVAKHEQRVFMIDYVYDSSGGLGTGSNSGSSGGSSRSRSGRSGEMGGEMWDELADTLDELKSEDGSVVIDKHSGMIVMEDAPERLNAMERFLTQFQRIVNRQVLIDAKLIEVALNEEYQMGVNWDLPNLNLNFLDAGTSGAASAGLATGSITQFLVSNDHVTALLEMLGEQGQLDVLSSPRLTTINNQAASISITEQIPYYTGQISTETSNIISWTVNFKQAGVTFQLVPQISEDGNLVIRVNHSISELVGYTDPVRAESVPIIDVREAFTTVRVGNGQTVIMGGLMRQKTSEELAMVPGLGHIPWLGALFRRTVQVSKKAELILLLTPRVLSTSEELAASTQEAVEAIERKRRGMHLGAQHELLKDE
ncbi:type II secretion system protein GspD, partial [bacterium]|nr:type II secretion system protein GspD [candidate division CSSED10-310 bacterium]